MTKDKKLYNYLVNTLGITKQVAMDHLKERLEDIVNKHISSRLDSKKFENLVLNKITQYLNEGVTKSWYERSTFEDFFKKTIDKVIMEKFNNEYTLEVKVVKKDATMIAKVR